MAKKSAKKSETVEAIKGFDADTPYFAKDGKLVPVSGENSQ